MPWPKRIAEQGIPGHKVHVLVVAGGNNELETVYDNQKGFLRQTRSDGRRVWITSRADTAIEIVVDPSNQNKAKPFFVLGAYLSMLMHVADVIITKPGGGTTAEIAYTGIPAVFDATLGLLHWEEFTVKAFEERGRGVRLKDAEDLMSAIEAALKIERSRELASVPHPSREGQQGGVIDSAREVTSVATGLIQMDSANGGIVFQDDGTNPDYYFVKKVNFYPTPTTLV